MDHHSITWVSIEWIRPNTLKEIGAFKGPNDLLNTLNEDFQGRLFAPLIHSRPSSLTSLGQNPQEALSALQIRGIKPFGKGVINLG